MARLRERECRRDLEREKLCASAETSAASRAPSGGTYTSATVMWTGTAEALQSCPVPVFFARLEYEAVAARMTSGGPPRPLRRLPLFLKKGCLSSRLLVGVTSCDAPGRLDAHLFLGVGRTPCRWELSRLLSSIRGRQAAKATRELAGTGVRSVVRGAGLKGWLRESMCQTAVRIVRATAALAALV